MSNFSTILLPRPTNKQIQTSLKPSTSKVKKQPIRKITFTESKSTAENNYNIEIPQTNFENNATATLINPAKNEIGRISKVIFKNINKELQNNLQLQQWNNTTSYQLTHEN